jgi:Ser-tRNA(Ala) deacylase AlaX
MEKQTHPPMHTAEHILNQTMVRMFGAGRCFSAHIEKKKSKCDYRFTRNLTAAETLGLENKINEIIKSNLPVLEEAISLEQAQAQYNLERLPEKTPTIRIIKIGDYDACPCRGEHVASTGEIGGFKIISTDFNEGVLRVRYRLQNAHKQ